MKLHLTTLREGRNPLSETAEPERLNLDPETFIAPVKIEGSADWSGDHADVQLHATAPAEFLCDRCADEFTLSVEADVRVQVLMQEVPDDDDENHEGLVYAGKQGTVVDLSEEIAEAIVLSVPLRRLCKDDCKGMCPYCYANLNEGDCEHVGQEPREGSEPGMETIADKLAKKKQR